MARFFLKVEYRGTHYSGSQIQENALTVQSALEKAMQVYYRTPIRLTGSSRTDAGVHALENFYHFDLDEALLSTTHPWLHADGEQRFLYNLNAILPPDIAVLGVYRTGGDAHSRFDALTREYHYFVYREKDPFLEDRAYYFPYLLDLGSMQAAAALLLNHADYSSFSKRGGQNRTPLCKVEESHWEAAGHTLCYRVRANRFLRGMVRGLVGTMLQVGRGKLSVPGFEGVLRAGDQRLADFSPPGQGLFLARVRYREGLLGEEKGQQGKEG
jgi:tRNA pseudouridine38-40 synthase